jgi:flagellar biosynthetic protein FliO
MDSMAFFPSLFKMLSALAVVLGIMIGGTYIIKKFLLPTTSDAGEGAPINVVATRYLGPKSSIMLIDVLGNIIVVGVTNNQMSFLTSISDPTSIEKLKGLNRKDREFSSLMDNVAKYRQRLLPRNRAGKGEGQE